MRNHDEIVSDEEHSGNAQHDLGPLWGKHRDEHGDGYSSHESVEKMERIYGQDGWEAAERPIYAQPYVREAACPCSG